MSAELCLGGISTRVIELRGSTSHERNCGINQVEANKALGQRVLFGPESVFVLVFDEVPAEIEDWTIVGAL